MYQKEMQKIKKQDVTSQSEIKDLNHTIANLNREKVNIMREMTLIHEDSLKVKAENTQLKEQI